MEDMAADGDDLEILNKGLDVFVADRANGFAGGVVVATDHLSSLYLLLWFRPFA